jgi:hypothetical protein
MLCVITTLEFFQHHFSEMGHRDLLVTQTYLSYQATTAPFISREASAAGRLCSNDVTTEVGTGPNLSDFATSREFATG